MSKKFVKPLSVAVGVAFVGSLAISQAATASDFSLVDMDAGYQLAGNPEADKAKEGKCGEGKCGGKMFDMMDTNKDGSVSRDECRAHHDKMFDEADSNKDGMISRAESDAAMKAHHEGKCGEGKFGGDKPKTEGKCGEGKCGGDKH